MNYPIYMDYNATTPCYPEVVEAMMPYFAEHFGNAASKNHPQGWVADDAVETARAQVATLIGAKSKEIIFTSGATEAINLGIRGIFEYYKGESQHYITCETEHKAVLDTFKYLEEQGAEVTYLTVDNFGRIDLSELGNRIQTHTKMVCLMWANNETGIIHPMSEIQAICKAHKVILMSDAVQAAGKIQINTSDIHLMAISAHKMYGPKGVGALFIRHNHPLPKPVGQLTGGGHEKGFRSGTLNVPAIAGFGKAAEIRIRTMEAESVRLEKLASQLEKSILEIPGSYLNGSAERLPHVINISFDGVEGEDLLRSVNKVIAVSSGSACSSITPKPSHVLQAMGVATDLARASIRFSLGTMTTESDVSKAAAYVSAVIEELRSK
jgi:cysteine desulfurase